MANSDKKMTIKELLPMEIDIDVYDDVDESLGIAFCGPIYLTEQGLKEFGEVLDYEVSYIDDDVAIVNIDADGLSWGEVEKRLSLATKLFHAAAGYCSSEDYVLWFVDEPIEEKEKKVESNKEKTQNLDSFAMLDLHGRFSEDFEFDTILHKTNNTVNEEAAEYVETVNSNLSDITVDGVPFNTITDAFNSIADSIVKRFSKPIVRPISHGNFGVFIPDGNNHADVIFEGTEEECYEYIKNIDKNDDYEVEI